MALLLPTGDISSRQPSDFLPWRRRRRKWNLFSSPTTTTTTNGFFFCNRRRRSNFSSSGSSSSGRRMVSAKAVSTQSQSQFQRVSVSKSFHSEEDAISALNERIRREQAQRQNCCTTRTDLEDADKYIRMVKHQQRRGLQILKRRAAGTDVDSNNTNTNTNPAFSYKVDPYSLRSGDYVVHRKVGVGRFVGIKLDLPKGASHPVEYVFIDYADGMAKLPLSQASRLLYRYNLSV